MCNIDLEGHSAKGEKADRLWVLAESGTAGPTASGEGPNRQPGYVALAVVGPEGTVSGEEQTGNTDRAENMLEFGERGLKLLRDALASKASGEKI